MALLLLEKLLDSLLKAPAGNGLFVLFFVTVIVRSERLGASFIDQMLQDVEKFHRWSSRISGGHNKSSGERAIESFLPNRDNKCLLD